MFTSIIKLFETIGYNKVATELLRLGYYKEAKLVRSHIKNLE